MVISVCFINQPAISRTSTVDMLTTAVNKLANKQVIPNKQAEAVNNQTTNNNKRVNAQK